MQMNIKVSTSWDYCFWWKWPDFTGVQPCLLLLVSLHSQTVEIFTAIHYNKIIKHQLCGEGLPSFLPLLQVEVFQQKQGISQKIILCPSNKPKEACIRLCDTYNFTQSLRRKYHHTAIEDIYRLFDVKINWTPTLAGVSYQFGFVRFPICLQCKISGSSVFSVFFFMKFQIIK